MEDYPQVSVTGPSLPRSLVGLVRARKRAAEALAAVNQEHAKLPRSLPQTEAQRVNAASTLETLYSKAIACAQEERMMALRCIRTVEQIFELRAARPPDSGAEEAQPAEVVAAEVAEAAAAAHSEWRREMADRGEVLGGDGGSEAGGRLGMGSAASARYDDDGGGGAASDGTAMSEAEGEGEADDGEDAPSSLGEPDDVEDEEGTVEGAGEETDDIDDAQLLDADERSSAMESEEGDLVPPAEDDELEDDEVSEALGMADDGEGGASEAADEADDGVDDDGGAFGLGAPAIAGIGLPEPGVGENS